jgi:hypothetical protein
MAESSTVVTTPPTTLTWRAELGKLATIGIPVVSGAMLQHFKTYSFIIVMTNATFGCIIIDG